MTLIPEAREAGAKACYESWIGGVEEAEPAWADLPESHRERMRAAFEAGASALAAHRAERVAVAWSFELAGARRSDGTYTNWSAPVVSFLKPNVPEKSIRNLVPLVAASPSPSSTAEARWRDIASAEKQTIKLTKAEIQSGHDRQRWAEGLIEQLPVTHEGRNSWLLNYGRKDEAAQRQQKRGLRWNAETDSVGAPPATEQGAR